MNTGHIGAWKKQSHSCGSYSCTYRSEGVMVKDQYTLSLPTIYVRGHKNGVQFLFQVWTKCMHLGKRNCPFDPCLEVPYLPSDR